MSAGACSPEERSVRLFALIVVQGLTYAALLVTMKFLFTTGNFPYPLFVSAVNSFFGLVVFAAKGMASGCSSAREVQPGAGTMQTDGAAPGGKNDTKKRHTRRVGIRMHYRGEEPLQNLSSPPGLHRKQQQPLQKTQGTGDGDDGGSDSNPDDPEEESRALLREDKGLRYPSMYTSSDSESSSALKLEKLWKVATSGGVVVNTLGEPTPSTTASSADEKESNIKATSKRHQSNIKTRRKAEHHVAGNPTSVLCRSAEYTSTSAASSGDENVSDKDDGGEASCTMNYATNPQDVAVDKNDEHRYITRLAWLAGFLGATNVALSNFAVHLLDSVSYGIIMKNRLALDVLVFFALDRSAGAGAGATAGGRESNAGLFPWYRVQSPVRLVAQFGLIVCSSVCSTAVMIADHKATKVGPEQGASEQRATSSRTLVITGVLCCVIALLATSLHTAVNQYANNPKTQVPVWLVKLLATEKSGGSFAPPGLRDRHAETEILTDEAAAQMNVYPKAVSAADFAARTSALQFCFLLTAAVLSEGSAPWLRLSDATNGRTPQIYLLLTACCLLGFIYSVCSVATSKMVDALSFGCLRYTNFLFLTIAAVVVLGTEFSLSQMAFSALMFAGVMWFASDWCGESESAPDAAKEGERSVSSPRGTNQVKEDICGPTTTSTSAAPSSASSCAGRAAGSRTVASGLTTTTSSGIVRRSSGHKKETAKRGRDAEPEQDEGLFSESDTVAVARDGGQEDKSSGPSLYDLLSFWVGIMLASGCALLTLQYLYAAGRAVRDAPQAAGDLPRLVKGETTVQTTPMQLRYWHSPTTAAGRTSEIAQLCNCDYRKLEQLYGKGLHFTNKYLDLLVLHKAFHDLTQHTPELFPEPLPYSLYFGSLLGFERHRSPTPYDDVADVVAPWSFWSTIEKFAFAEGLIADRKKKFASLPQPSGGENNFTVAVTYRLAPVRDLDEVFELSKADVVLFLPDRSWRRVWGEEFEGHLDDVPAAVSRNVEAGLAAERSGDKDRAIRKAHGSWQMFWEGAVGGRFVMRRRRHQNYARQQGESRSLGALFDSTVVGEEHALIHGGEFYASVDVSAWVSENDPAFNSAYADPHTKCHAGEEIQRADEALDVMAVREQGELHPEVSGRKKMPSSTAEGSVFPETEVTHFVGGLEVRVFKDPKLRKKLVENCYGRNWMKPKFRWLAGDDGKDDVETDEHQQKAKAVSFRGATSKVGVEANGRWKSVEENMLLAR